MAGHSKWHNIKHKKARADKKRGKIFAKLGREIAIAARDGGDPATNPALRLAMDRAKSYEMPNDTIERAIKRGTGEDKKAGTLEQILYEAYGPDGVPLLLNVITDNRNRTVSDLRHLLEKHGGKLAESGSVQYQFEQRGVLYVTPIDNARRDDVELAAIDAGADDITWNDTVLRVIVSRDRLHVIKQVLEQSDVLTLEDADIEWIPTTPQQQPDNKRLETLLEILEDHDDVTDIFTPFKK